MRLLSGPRSSGKTTELRRLYAELEASGHTARLVDISGYISQASEVDAVQFLIAIALGVDEALPSPHADADASRWSLRFTSFLSRINATARPEGAGVVLVVDDLEKVRGAGGDDRAVQESVERLFVPHAERLRFPSPHVVYTVPSYLIFTDSGALPYDGAVRAVPVPHLYGHGSSEPGRSCAEWSSVASTSRRGWATTSGWSGSSRHPADTCATSFGSFGS